MMMILLADAVKHKLSLTFFQNVFFSRDKFISLETAIAVAMISIFAIHQLRLLAPKITAADDDDAAAALQYTSLT